VMDQLPASWALLPVSEVVRNITLTDKKIPQKKYLSGGKFPVFDQGQEYLGGYTDDAEMLVDCVLPVIVFGDHTRVVKLVNTAFAPGADGVKVLQPSACILPKLLEHFVRYLVTKIPNNGYARHYQHLAKSSLPIPPLAEQHRIVAKIEELFSELDQGVASLKTAREQLKVYRQSLLKIAFDGKLTAAVAWREKPLGQLLGFLTSGSRGWAAYYASSGDLFVRAQNIKHDCLELDDVAFVSLPDKAEGLRTRVQQGDLLITITGANVTKAALVKDELGTAFVSQHVALCRPTTEILPDYLYWFIVAEAAGRKQLTEMAYGAGKPGLNLENIRSVQVPLPSLSEQQEIVELIQSKLSEADQLDQTLATALQQAEALRQSILKKAFCGQLVNQDKNDEPATALLERIRAEKPDGMKVPGKRGKSREYTVVI
jgi:type I restriction enzyme S subunit